METTHVTIVTCEWYALCDNPANGSVRHSVLGEVPTCARCANKHDLTFTYQEASA